MIFALYFGISGDGFLREPVQVDFVSDPANPVQQPLDRPGIGHLVGLEARFISQPQGPVDIGQIGIAVGVGGQVKDQPVPPLKCYAPVEVRAVGIAIDFHDNPALSGFFQYRIPVGLGAFAPQQQPPGRMAQDVQVGIVEGS